MDSPGSSDWSPIEWKPSSKLMAPPSPMTATDKLHEADCEYHRLIALVHICKDRYKREHAELHKIHVLIHSINGDKLMEEVHRIRLTEWMMDDQGKSSAMEMGKARKVWMKLVTEANAVRKQIAELEKLVAAEKWAAEKAAKEAEERRAEEEYEALEYEAEDAEGVLKSEADEE